MAITFNHNDQVYVKDGKLGIGTASPAAKLEVLSGGGIHITDDSLGRTLIIKPSLSGAVHEFTSDNTAAGYSFSNNSSEFMRIAADGNVGIGTTSPSYKLHVDGDIGINANDAFKARYDTNENYHGSFRWSGLQLGNNGANKIIAGRTGTAGYFQFYVNNTNDASDYNVTPDGTKILTLAADGTSTFTAGNVGIGTTSPAAKLHIKINDSGATPISQQHLVLEHNSATGLGILTTSSTSGYIFFGDENDAQRGYISYNHPTDDMTFKVAGSERMRIINNGNVGIGTTSPAHPLHVNGAARLQGALEVNYGVSTADAAINVGVSRTDSGYAYLDLIGDTTYTDYGLRVIRGNSGANASSQINHRGTGDFEFRALEAANITFDTNATERMRITSAGNVGIGTASPTSQFTISDPTAPTLEFNRQGSTANGWIKTTDSSQNVEAAIQMYGNEVRLFTNGESNQRMMIDASGNVGIGTTAPVSLVHASNGNYRVSNETAATFRGYVFGATAGDSTEYSYLKWEPQGGELRLWNNPAAFGGFFSIYTNAVERLRITSAGNIGIGTTAPNHKLDVSGVIMGRSGISTYGYHRTIPVYSYSNGILIATNIATSDNNMIQLEVSGNTYSNGTPLKAQYQCYNYTSSGTFIRNYGISTHPELEVDVFHYNGYVYFWMEQVSDFNTLTFELYSGLYSDRRITQTSNSAKPTTGVTNSVTIVPKSWWHSGNDGTGSGLDADLLDGLEATAFATAAQGTKADTAHGWGDHSTEGYAPLASPALTGTPTAPTAGSTTNNTQLATTAFVQTAVSNLVDSAPGTLDTLNELAAALGDDANFSTTMTTALGNRLRIDTNAQGLNATQQANGRTNLGLGTAATSASTDFVSATADDTMAGKLTIQKVSSSVSQGSFSHSNAHLDLYNSWESNTDQKGSIITFTDNYYDGSNYIKTTRAAIKGGTDTVGNTADGYLEFYTDSAGANSPSLALRLDRNQNATFSGTITATGGNSTNWNTAYGWGNHGSAGYITSQRAISSTPTDGATTTAISSDWAFDNVKTAVPANAVFTDTVNTFDGAYTSLTGLPTLGTAAATASTDFATAAQGTKADNALPISAGSTKPLSDNLHFSAAASYIFGGDDEILAGQDGSAYYYATGNGQNLTKPVFIGDNNAYIRFNSGNSEKMRITNAGNVGIGTTGPAKRLSVETSDTATYDPTINASEISVSRKNSSNTAGQVAAISLNATGWSGQTTGVVVLNAIARQGNFSNADFAIQNRVGGSFVETFRITTYGNVGIGTDTPDDNINTGTYFKPDSGGRFLTVKDSSGSFIMLESSTTTDDDQIGGIYFNNTVGQADAHVHVAGIDAILHKHGTNDALSGGDLRFFTKPSGSGINGPRMVILQNGNVGIGTTNPGKKLDVNGEARVNSILTLNRASAASLKFSRGSDFYLGIDDSGNLNFLNNAASSLGVWQNTGNVGIGTTSPSTKLHIDSVDGSSNRTSPFNVLTIEAESGTLPYTGFGGGIVFKNRTYTYGMLTSARIRSVIDADSASNRGAGLTFETTDVNQNYISAISLKYNGAIQFPQYGAGFLVTDANGNISSDTNTYLTSVAFSDLTTTPTTIAGYGITDALQIGTTATTALAGDTSIPASGTDFDPVGTDNSTDVTLDTSSYDYLSISGQEITLGQIDYDADITNLPTLGTAAAADTGDFASATQGATADSALQPADIITFAGDGEGLVPDGTSADASKFLNGDAGWTVPTNTVTSVGVSGDLSTGNITLAGSGDVTVTKSGGTITIDCSDTDTQYTAGAGLDLTGTSFSIEADLSSDVHTIGRDADDKYVVNTTNHAWYLDGVLDMRLANNGTLDVDGDVVAFSTVTNSDRRLKTDIETIENASEKVSKLRGVSYTWDHGKRKGQRDIGLIAQEVEEVVPEVVSEGQLLDGTTAKRVDYAKLVGLLIESNKELQAQVNELKDRLDGITK